MQRKDPWRFRQSAFGPQLFRSSDRHSSRSESLYMAEVLRWVLFTLGRGMSFHSTPFADCTKRRYKKTKVRSNADKVHKTVPLALFSYLRSTIAKANFTKGEVDVIFISSFMAVIKLKRPSGSRPDTWYFMDENAGQCPSSQLHLPSCHSHYRHDVRCC